MIDVVGVSIILAVPLSYIYGANYWLSTQMYFGVWDFLLQTIAPAIATIGLWLRFSATPGKMATNLKVVDADSGKPMTLLQATARYLAYIPAILPLGLGLFWVAIDEKKQGWHDKIADTVVIQENTKKPVLFHKKS